MRKQKLYAYQTENNIFSTRLRECMALRHVNQEMLAKEVGVRRQTISLYTTGQSKPDVEALAKIVVYLDVSAEYLLGLTEDMSRTPTAMDQLGLSARAVNNILRVKEEDSGSPPMCKSLNALLGSKRFPDVIADLASYFYGKSVTLRQPDGKRIHIPIESSTDFMEFIRPSCLARIQESLVNIKADIDMRPESDLSTKTVPRASSENKTGEDETSYIGKLHD